MYGSLQKCQHSYRCYATFHILYVSLRGSDTWKGEAAGSNRSAQRPAAHLVFGVVKLSWESESPVDQGMYCFVI